MGWIRKTFLYREDYNPALQGLRGVAVLWFFHMSFYGQFDPAKLTRITGGKPWLGDVINSLPILLSPGLIAPVLMYVLAGFLAVGSLEKSSFPRFLLARALRFYPVYLVAVLPVLAYTNSGFSNIFQSLTFFVVPQDIPVGSLVVLAAAFWLPILWAGVQAATKIFPNLTLQAGIFLACAGLNWMACRDFGTTIAFLGVFAGILAGVWAGVPTTRRKRHLPVLATRYGAGPCLVGAVVLAPFALKCLPSSFNAPAVACSILLAWATASLAAFPASRTGRFLSHPVFRYFGAVALPFFLIHTTWGFRLSRSILQGELQSIGAVVAHYAMSLAFSTVFAGFLHVFFERPHFLRNLRNGPPAATKPGSDVRGAAV